MIKGIRDIITWHQYNMIQYQALHTTNHWRKDSRVAEGFRYFIVLGISETAAGTRQSPENVPRKAHGLLLRVKIHTVPHKHGKDVENARSCNCTELVQYHKWWPDSDHTEWTELVTDANTTRHAFLTVTDFRNVAQLNDHPMGDPSESFPWKSPWAII